MSRFLLIAGALLAFTGVAAGAFGAHMLKERLSPEMSAVFETGVRYQIYHALALILLGILVERFSSSYLTLAGWLMIAGVLVFSGSLYILTLSGQRWLGAVTPLGGTSLLAGWLLLAWGIWMESS